MYSDLVGGSIVGADHQAAPAGPKSCMPALFLPRGDGASGIVKVCHTRSPVAASSATTLPRNVQQPYEACAPVPSSPEAIPTYRRPLYSTADPVILAARCSSSFFFQSSSPVAAFTAYMVPGRSPKNAVGRPLTGAITTAARTPPSALNIQCWQPSARPSENTRPEALPTNTRSPTIVGFAAAAFSPSKPNAQRSLRFGT